MYFFIKNKKNLPHHSMNNSLANPLSKSGILANTTIGSEIDFNSSRL